MTVFIAFLLLSFQPKPSEAEPLKVIIRGDTPESMCALIYEARTQEIAKVSEQMDGLTSRNDWEKLSPEAQDKLKKPFRTKLDSLRKARSIAAPTRVPWDVQLGELFTMPVVKDSAKKWRTQSRVDKTTILVFCEIQIPGDRYTSAYVAKKYAVLEGVRGLPAKLDSGKPIDTDGLWQRIDDLKLEGKDYMRYRRWPNESEVKKLWPKYLTEQEAKATPDAIKPAAPAKKSDR